MSDFLCGPAIWWGVNQILTSEKEDRLGTIVGEKIKMEEIRFDTYGIVQAEKLHAVICKPFWTIRLSQREKKEKK
jgi:hypothetical protein